MESNPVSVTLEFYGWLTKLVRRGSNRGSLRLSLTRRTSIKDLIETCGVPHTEVGSIQVDRRLVTFNHIVVKQSFVEIFPLCPPVNVLIPSLLRPSTFPRIRFLVDANVGKLAGKLRMAGFDTFFNLQWDDTDLANISEKKQCILLTRDIMLLKRKKITHGHFVRETLPARQLAEVIHFYGLADKINAFTRCIRCNGNLVPVAKHEIHDQLEPLTRKYYSTFYRCNSCLHVYWSGSHRDSMAKHITELENYCPLHY